MRIGLLTTSFPRTAQDFAGHFVLGFAQALCAQGHQVEVLAPAPAQSCPEVAGPELAEPSCFGALSVHHVRYAFPPRSQQLFYGAGVPENLSRRPYLAPQLLSFSAQLGRTVARRAPHWDGIVSHWALPCGLVAAQAAPRLPHLAVCHSADVHALGKLPSPLGNLLRSRLARQSRALWFVHRQQRATFCTHIHPDALPPIHVGPMGHWPPAPLDRGLARQRAGIRGNRPTALVLSRLVPIKGIDRALSAVAEAKDWDLIVAGNGPEARRLQDLARRAPGRVRFVGAVHGEFKSALLQGADALLYPSQRERDGRSEGAPLAIIEGFAAGLPVLAAATGGLPELLAHGQRGQLLPADDPRAWTAALTRLQREPALPSRLRKAGMAYANTCSWQALGPRIAQLLFP